MLCAFQLVKLSTRYASSCLVAEDMCLYTPPGEMRSLLGKKNVLLLFKYGILESIKDPIKVCQHSLEKS